MLVVHWIGGFCVPMIQVQFIFLFLLPPLDEPWAERTLCRHIFLNMARAERIKQSKLNHFDYSTGNYSTGNYLIILLAFAYLTARQFVSKLM